MRYIKGLKDLIVKDESTLLLEMEYEKSAKHVLIDVGAANGSFAKNFAKKGWQVVAFEPESQNFKDLCDNLRNYPDSICINKAVSNFTGKAKFYTSKDHYGIHSLKPFHKDHRLSSSVDVIRLDEALDAISMDNVTLLKIDIEGADYLALQGFNFQKLRPELVMCEFMDERSSKNFSYTHHDMAEFMNRFDYCTYISEWGPIAEYSSRNHITVPSKFIRCSPYPLDHVPIWGNLIFVRKNCDKNFKNALENSQYKIILSNILCISATKMISRLSI